MDCMDQWSLNLSRVEFLDQSFPWDFIKSFFQVYEEQVSFLSINVSDSSIPVGLFQIFGLVDHLEEVD